ncbi:TonB-dependent receptor [Ulvibacterium sp.]|uniref:TonB-dependent receptor n=1 Tax=Ulvibacterium sp. TaxID=2665914 RepID=UPI00262623E7|nr:TonB-dependent receptor [Ulvibacterium sp.]
MKANNLLKLLFVTLFVFLGVAEGKAQSGNIQGTISDENGIYVSGANIFIVSLNKGTVSDFDGRFTLVDVPEGNYNIQITYIGYADVDQEVAVTDGETASIIVELTPTNYQLDEVEVAAQGLSGQAKALNTQRTNLNITNVVSTDQIGKFPDANIGDAVKRIPGITMQVDQGEARDVIVRGLSPQLNSVTLNGSRIPSAEGDNRNIQMDLIPSDMIQTIEVNKAVTPDMDGDALGGSINLVTRSAPQGFRLSTTLGSGINFITNTRNLNGAFLLGDRSKNGKFGWMLGAVIQDNDFGSDNVEAEWDNEFAFSNALGEEEEIDVNPYTNVFEQRTYLVQRVRRSFSVNLDYQFDSNNSIYLKTMYNWRDDRENRYVVATELLDWDEVPEGDFTLTNNTPTRFPAEVARETKGGIDDDRNQNTRLEDQRMQNYTLGGNHLWGKAKIDWLASYAKASEERLDERYAQYKTEYIVNNDNTDPEFPIMTAEDAANTNDRSIFEFDEITNETQYTDEEDINLFLNIELPADIFGKGDGTLKFGARGRFKNKTRDNNFFEYGDLGDTFEFMSDIPVVNKTDPDFLAGGQYAAGLYPDPVWLGRLDLNENNGESVVEEFLPGNFDIREDVIAGYIMLNQKLSNKLSVLAGVRIENTQLESDGFRVTFNEDDIISEEVSGENSYTNVLPGVHFKYDFTDNTILRLAWSNTLARANYEDLIPRAEIVNADDEIVLGNADLDPTTSMNFDLMAEHYLESIGIISGGLFYKRIDDFIYTFISEAPDDSFGPGTEGFDVFQPLNGDQASIFGVEFSFQRQLDFLPGFARNFNIFLNYTHLTSSADGIRNEDGDERTDMDLPNTAPNMFNASLGYAGKRFSARLSANFSDSYVDELGGNAFEDRYYDQQFFLDFNSSYAFNNRLRIYADLNNITNQPLRFFQGVSERTQQVEYYGLRFTFGLKYDLFRK